MMALLELDSVTAGYGGGPDILDDLSLALDEGTFGCIIGPNGAGKSTMLKVIAGLLRPRSGTVRFKGEVLNGLRPDQTLARGICFVPQDRSLFPDMSVRENLIMGGFLEGRGSRRELDRRLRHVFEMFPPLEKRSAQRARTLSGGEQQMVALGRSMMLTPEVMLIDEPSLGLAPRLARQIFQTIRRFKDLGMSVLLVEQNARKGLEISDWGFVLDLGRKRFEGPADTILENPEIRQLYLGRRLSARTGERRLSAPAGEGG
jgi:branched-chain amino acid transport system ATP-binding protein